MNQIEDLTEKILLDITKIQMSTDSYIMFKHLTTIKEIIDILDTISHKKRIKNK